MLPVNNS